MRSANSKPPRIAMATWDQDPSVARHNNKQRRQHMKHIIKTTDCDIYEVTLVVAIPNYGENGADATALDYILNELDSEITVLSSSELLLSLIPETATPTSATTLAKTTQATLAEEAFEIDEYLDEDAEFNNALLTVAFAKLEQPVTLTVVEAHLAKQMPSQEKPTTPLVALVKSKGRGKRKKQRVPTPMMMERQEKVLAVLVQVDDATADEIASWSEIEAKLVYNVLYDLHKDKRIIALRQSGNRVRWSVRKASE